MPFNNGYIITSRATELSFFGNPEFSDANPTPIDPTGKSGAMYFLVSGQPYDQNYNNYSFTNAKNGNNYVPSATFPPPFANLLRQDLARSVVNGRPQITIYIHGLEVTYGSAVQTMAQLGADLFQSGGYSGLVVGFSWPSGIPDPLNYATTWPTTGSGTTVRDNIVNSVQAFVTLLQALVRLVSNLTINIVCHSEGNYMLMRGMAALSGVQVNQAIMLAADISNATLQLTAQNNGGINGQAIASQSNNVSIYSSIYDEDLLYSNLGYLSFHNPKFPLRLGQTGVYSFAAQNGALYLPANVNGIDCSAVVNDANIINLVNQGVITLPPNPLATKGTNLPFIHSSYRYLPQVLQDMTAVMTGQKPVDRTVIPNTNGQGFQMNVVTAARAVA